MSTGQNNQTTESGSTDCSDAHPRVKGYCPSCGGDALFVGTGGYVTCAKIGCENPGAATDVLKGWDGTPVYDSPSRLNDGSGRVFHRDHAGQRVAEFTDAKDAELFCKMVGEKSQWRKNGDSR